MQIDAALKRIVLASNNTGKLREFATLFGPSGIEIVPQGTLDVPEAEEPHATFVENALVKARHAARLTGLPAIADDSGLCVRALGGAPGVYSARYALRAGQGQGDAANNAHLVATLQGVQDRRAYYYCVLVLVRHADDPEPLIAEGRWHGEVVDTARGANGFGYDPHFLIPERKLTVAELAPELKSSLSHRATALRAMFSLIGAAA